MPNQTQPAPDAADGHHRPAVARDGFATNLGAILATLGSAVGLGNIWKFPSLVGQNGGGAFILLYLLCIALVGLPVLIGELAIGRKAHANAVTAFKKLAPRQPWYLIGVSGMAAAVIILAFYTDVAGWVFAYIWRAAQGALSIPGEQTAAVYDALVQSPFAVLFWQAVVIGVAVLIISAGVANGIEKVTKRLMPLLFALLLICSVRALTLPGAGEGLAFLLKPDFSSLSSTAVLDALGLAFFKLSLGMGTMITYGSYMPDTANLPASATKVALADTLVSLLAGLAIFPAVFAFGYEPSAGPSLLFITIPAVFASMPFGRLFTFLFFILTAIAAMGAILSLFEVPVSYLVETRGHARQKAALLTAAGLLMLGIPAALSTNVLSSFTIFGLTVFDLCDFVSSNILLPVGGVAIALFVGWRWGKKAVQDAISNQGQLQNRRLIGAMVGVLRFFTPVAISVVLLDGLGVLNLLLGK